MSVIEKYDIAQICTSGHVINSSCKNQPSACTDFCALCGSPTIKECPSCRASIPGDAYGSQVLFATLEGTVTAPVKINTEYTVPAFCSKCGKPYPWTAKFLENANKIVDLMDGLSPEQKEQLKETFPNLLVEKPESQYDALVAGTMIHQITSFGKDVLINLLKDNIPTKLFELMQLE
ncbi:DUF2321 domain-containing protein [uncultured Megasphaera sp.]|uniref:DUF2321 domain-containing protein n=1 Tax=uncultured Megasphaera sp. TaxID=165188 RepID=UPI00259A19D9|nr:DUF2321 domain-containing protein [uncultured Megasphaera sp.]